MAHTKEGSAKHPVELPPQASLLGIAPELRNTIYHMIALDIEEASIIGRKINFEAPDDEDFLWTTFAKHPLSQTCRQVRAEFDPIHRHRALITGVPHYILELQNYDLNRIADFARLLEQAPSIFPHLCSCVKASKPIIRFQIDRHVAASVKRLREDLQYPYRLRTPFLKLKGLFEKEWKTPLTWAVINLCIVDLKLRNPKMSDAEKRVAATEAMVKRADKALKVAKWRVTYYGHGDSEYLSLLYCLQKSAYETTVRMLRKDELRTELKAELTLEIRDDLEARLRTQLHIEPHGRKCVVKQRRGMNARLREELKAELQNEIGDEVEVEVKEQLLAL